MTRRFVRDPRERLGEAGGDLDPEVGGLGAQGLRQEISGLGVGRDEEDSLRFHRHFRIRGEARASVGEKGLRTPKAFCAGFCLPDLTCS
jgi:hypothetical protein